MVAGETIIHKRGTPGKRVNESQVYLFFLFVVVKK